MVQACLPNGRRPTPNTLLLVTTNLESALFRAQDDLRNQRLTLTAIKALDTDLSTWQRAVNEVCNPVAPTEAYALQKQPWHNGS